MARHVNDAEPVEDRLRERLAALRLLTAQEVGEVAAGSRVATAGLVINRQRPGTAKGVVFVSLEDESGVANAVVFPDLFEKRRLIITQHPALIVEGKVQTREGVIHIKAERIEPLLATDLPAAASHDFH
jgi:error-prone DNA polymerase